MHWLHKEFQSQSEGSGVCSLIKVWPCRGRSDQSYLSAASSRSLALPLSPSEQPFMSSTPTICRFSHSLSVSAQNRMDVLPFKHLKTQHLRLYVALAGILNGLAQLKVHTRPWLMNISPAPASHDVT